jgi:cytochrome b subunit of formate dehydrogenase
MTVKTAPSTTTKTRPSRRIERYGRPARWYHAMVYVASFVLLFTGWWLLAGGEGSPSWIARLMSTTNATLHLLLGWAFAVVAVTGAMVGFRAVRTFVRGSLKFHRGDAAWFARWPGATLTGRFAPHRGHFDPGQRIANLVIGLCLGALVVTGVGMASVHGGPAFVWFVRVHRWSTYVLTPVVIGHVLITSGILPGYRGVWRSMHLGGRVDDEVARRLWPESRPRPRGETRGGAMPKPSGGGRLPTPAHRRTRPRPPSGTKE